MTRHLQRLLATAVFLIIADCATAQPAGQASADTPAPATGWKIKFDESGSNPVIVAGVLYMGSADGAVYALDPKTGETTWRFQTGESLSSAASGPQVVTVPPGTSIADQMAAGMNAAEKQRGAGIRRVDMTPAVEGGMVFIGSGDQSFYAIDAATGKKKWSYVAGSGMASNNFTSYPVPAAVLKNGSVYFVTDDGLHALDSLTGERKWLFETLQEIPIEQMNLRRKRTPSRPVVGDGALLLTAWPYIGGNTPSKSFVYAVDQDSGKAKWVTSVDGLDITAPTMAKELVFVAVEGRAPQTSPSNNVTLHAINAAGGEVKWKFGAQKNYGTAELLVSGDTIFFSTDKSLLALELETGRPLWTFSADEISRNLLADEQHVYVVTHKRPMMGSKGTLHALALATGQEKWSRRLNASIAIVKDGVLYADGGRLHAMDAATGKALWSFKGTGRESARLISAGRIFLTSPTVSYIGTKQVDQGYFYAINARTGKLNPSLRMK